MTGSFCLLEAQRYQEFFEFAVCYFFDIFSAMMIYPVSIRHLPLFFRFLSDFCKMLCIQKPGPHAETFLASQCILCYQMSISAKQSSHPGSGAFFRQFLLQLAAKENKKKLLPYILK